MSDSHEQFSSLSPEQRALLLLRLKKQKQQDAKKEQQAITRQSRDSNQFPLSFEQQGIWFLEQFEKESLDYNVATAFALTGELNVPAFEKSINDLVERHEILRTTFKVVDGQPVQVISPGLTIALTKIDLRDLPQAEQTQKVSQLAAAEDNSAFDLNRGPLIRVSLLRLGDESHVLLLTMHHIVFDGWSKSIIYSELSELYRANVDNTASRLPDPEIQYADFASWQIEFLQSESFARQLDYWKQRLRGAPPEIGLPTDRPRTGMRRIHAKTGAFSIGPESTTRLKALAASSGTTLFTVLFSVYALLLSRYCGQQDVVIGVPLANRNRKQLERVIGIFINTVVVRVDLSGNIDFLELLDRTRRAVQESFDNSDIPFQKLVQEIHPERNLGYMPIFQVTFNLLNAPVNAFDLQGLSVSHLELRNVAAGNIYDLTFTMEEHGERIKLIPEYNAAILDAETVETMVGNFQMLLEGCLADPEIPLESLNMLTAAERDRILRQWNDTRVEFDRDHCVHELFEARAAAGPDALAVEHEGETLDYRQLNERANQLAHYLQARGVGPEVMVAVYLERSLEMIVGLLAILKAGGAYVPLDLEYPQSRIAFMLQDTAVPVVLSTSDLAGNLPDFTGELVCLDSDWAKLGEQGTDNPKSAATADNLAYVIYTSGSTGTPKGVEVPHRGLSNLVNWHIRSFDIGPKDRATHLAGLGFDASVWELWPYLACGASLYLVSNERRLAPAKLWSWMAEQGISISFLPTPLAEAALREPIPANLGLRLLLTGGDRLHGALARQPLPFRVINNYGPTENSVVTTSTEIDVRSAEDPPIGRPIDNVQLYILDENLRPVPVGAWGELYIGGESLARGYLNQPELTAEKFIANPFSEKPGARLYRSGDLVRYRRDGQIEFHGRIDHQVKIRGFRIDLGEIESVLLSHQLVSDTVVVVNEEEPDDKRLVAYLVAGNGVAPTIADLRDLVARSLPHYMMPAAFMMLDKLPLTANGKVDRKALPLPEDIRASHGAEYMSPRTEIEQELARIWAEVLKLERVGIHDNFFDLGGHSLMATQVVSRIRGRLNAELPLSEMFAYPSVAEFAPVVQSVLGSSLRQDTDVIPLADRDGMLPLSFAQERLWFLDQLEPGSSTYNMMLTLRLKGELRVEALEESLNAIVNRQEGLRTHFALHQGTPFQVIDDIGIELQKDDISELATERFEEEVKARIDAEALLPFDLSNGPLLRCRLLHLSDREHVLMLTMHHVISDGWSMGILFRELGACYAAFSAGRQPDLPELPIQYADFASWQREWLSGKVLASQLDYWKNQLNGLSVLELPTDRPRPPVQTHNGAIVRSSLPKDFEAELELFSQRRGVSLFMTLLAAFAVLMHRYSGQEDIVVGSPIANRNRSELEGLIGFFVNSLVMRTDVSENPSFTQLVERVKRTVLGAFDHQDLPFEKLVDEMHPDRDRSRNPLFQVMFTLQNASAEKLELQDLTLETGGNEIRVTRLDLEVHIWQRADTFNINFIYNTDLFDEATISRLLLHYQRLLEVMVASPETCIADAPMLTAQERQQLLIEWNQTATDYPRDETVHRLFEIQAAATPDAIAVECDDKTLSYQELNQHANRLAHYLKEGAVGTGTIVGICIERSLEMIIGLLAILKAGGVYLPLDPDYPVERLNTMLNDSGAKLLLGKANLPAELAFPYTRIICLERDAQAIAAHSDQNLPGTSNADDVAYLIYTSGSTGKPKAVMGLHRGVVNRLCWMWQAYPYQAGERCLQKTTLSFVDAVAEIFSPLLSGLNLVVASEAASKDARALAELISNKGVTRLIVVPSLLRAFLELEEEVLRGLECIHVWVTSGEKLDQKLELAFHTRFPGAQLLNLYGSSEVAADATCFDTSKRNARDGSLIGRPIANMRCYVLDSWMNPVPMGVTGELYIGGDGVAGGYLNRPELTAEKFISDPFSSDPAARLYRTGDLVRYQKEGNLEYIGRIDHQVKLRGFRVELGEIESTLVEHEAVREAAVMLREDEPGDQRLVAYVVPDRAEATLVSDLRSRVRSKLPEFMLPSAFVALDRLPLNANGKLDRYALPVPGDMRATLGTEYTAPRNELEQQLAEIWEEVLKLERVGVHDNFFDLGGHSLMATQVVSRIRNRLAAELPLSEMFGYSTVAELAPVVESLLDDRAKEEAYVIPIADREASLPLSFAQERLWFLDQLEPGSSAYNMPLALRLKGKLNMSALESSINAIFERQQGLRTHFVLQHGKPFQVIDDFMIDLVQDDLSTLKPETLEEEVTKQIDAEASKPFDLSTGPLLRCRLLCLSDLEHVLLMTMHHVISDGWSLGVLFRELGACYEALNRGEQPILDELPVQYTDFAVWQRGWLSGEVLDSQLQYWREKLENLSTLDLPTDRPRPAVQTYSGAGEKLLLDAELSDCLRSLSRRQGVTLFMTMLAGFAVLLYRYCGQDDIVVGTPIANRNRAELENLIGFFVNSLVMRTDVSGDPNFTELVQRVNRTALEAYEHQDLPFEKLVDEIQPDRDLSHNPLFQVMFAMQNMPVGSLELEGLTLESIRQEIRVSAFDLECHVWEKAEQLSITFVYNTDLFDTSTIRRLMKHYRCLLAAAVATPEKPVGELEILEHDEKLLMLRQWNQTRVDYATSETLHSLLQQQVRRTPRATALRFEQESLDYAELEHRTNELASLLLAKNVKPGQFVGIFLERSIDLVVAVLGILKAGAAYVPLDPEYPEAHLNYIMTDSNTRVVLSQQRFQDRLPSDLTDVIYLDAIDAFRDIETRALPVVTPDMLAYVIYTSGSTGKPKGVMVSHGAVVNHACWMRDLFGIDASDRMLQKSPISFDASVCEIFVPLLNGACVVLAVPGGDRDIKYLIEEIRKNQITMLILVPSALRILLQNLDDPAALETLKIMGCGGEALTQELKQAYYERCSAPLYNLYGPTESTIDATSFLCAREFEQDNIPIGYPVSNKQAYILDRRLQPVPIGVHGELHIGGVGLALGYLNQPELTAAQFIPDPFSDDPQARLYKTGDQARYRADGSIEYLGRIDHQVKVRGFRIELGEIETVLSRHEFIDDCAALVYEDRQGYRNIAAYFVSDSSISTLSLRNYLRKKLPHYMIPTLLTQLDRIPVTPNGKTDYLALASQAKGKTIRDRVFHPPETAAEKKIAGIWETLLNVNRIDVGDNFFDIGGHSLLLIQARSAIEEEVGVSVPLMDFFHQTLGQIATYCERNQQSGTSVEEV